MARYEVTLIAWQMVETTIEVEATRIDAARRMAKEEAVKVSLEDWKSCEGVDPADVTVVGVSKIEG